MLRNGVFHACMGAKRYRPNGRSVRQATCFSAKLDLMSAMPGTARGPNSSPSIRCLSGTAQRHPFLLEAQAIAMSVVAQIIEHALL
jgi:hypothetical protein